MIIHDISMSIHPDMPVYKNQKEKRPVLRFLQGFSTGESCASNLTLDTHTGTHVDAPLHMLPGGKTIDNLDLARVITRCKVLDFSFIQEKITRRELVVKNIEKGDFILLKTRNSYTEQFEYDFVYLDKTGAAYFKELAVTGVGIDALGIERNQPDHATHKTLFQAGIVILEGLRLKEIAEGSYFLFAAPLKITGAEGAPTRAVLLQ